MAVMYAEELNAGKRSVTLHSTDRHGIVGQKSADWHGPLCSWQAERAPDGPADRAIDEQGASPPARAGAPQEPAGILVVGNGGRPPVVDASGGGDALDVRTQTRRGPGYHARVCRAAPRGAAGRVGAHRLTPGEAGADGRAAGDGGDLGAGRVGERRGAQGHWRRGCNVRGTHASGPAGPRHGLSPVGRGGGRSALSHVAGVGRGAAQGPGPWGAVWGQCPRAGPTPARSTRAGRRAPAGCFHVVHAIVQSEARARGQRWRHAEPAPHAASARVEARPAEGTRWAEGAHISRSSGASRSRTLPPFCRSDSPPQPSAQGASPRTTAVEAIEAFALSHQWPARPEARRQGRKQGLAWAARVACGWHGVHRDVAPCRLAPRGRQGVHEGLRPLVYGDAPGGRTRGRRRKAPRHAAWHAAPAACDRPPIPPRLAPHVLEEGHAWALDRGKALPHASSAVEGRHGFLAPMPPNHRGRPQQRAKG